MIAAFLGGRRTRCSSLQMNLTSAELIPRFQGRRGEPAASQEWDRGAQSSSDPPSPILHQHFSSFLTSFLTRALFLAMNQVTHWSQQEFPGCFSSSWKGAAQAQLKKYFLKNINLLDLTQFVLNRLESTPFILINFEIP